MADQPKAAAVVVSRKIGEGVVLYSESTKGPPCVFKYSIESTGFKVVRFTFNFNGSENFELLDVGKQGNTAFEECVVVEPLGRSKQVVCRQVDKFKGATLKMSMSWIVEDPGPDHSQKYLQTHDANLAHVLEKAKTVFDEDPTTHAALGRERSLQALVDQCNKNGVTFLDTSFTCPMAYPAASSIFAVGESHGVNAFAEPDSRPPIVWRRPVEFALPGETYALFSKDGDKEVEPNDIKQGQLGDCWLMCSLSSIAEFAVLVKSLFLEYSVEHGIFRVRLCKNGEWVVVTVDDYFPCVPEGGPIYSHAHGPELWVMVLEKAFAKVHGSYAAIRSGWPYEAMMDLTGAPYKDIKFADNRTKAKREDGSLWADLLSYDLKQYIMSCSTSGVDKFTEGGTKPQFLQTGLVPGHAYTLISVVTTSPETGSHKLVRIRNPWGSLEWTGDWSDSSPLWTPEIKANLKEQTGCDVEVVDDGCFWMSFDDLLVHFVGISVCLVRHKGINDHPWIEAREKFEFKFSDMGRGRVVAPTYTLVLEEGESEVFATVHQQDKRCIGKPKYIDFGVTVLRPLDNGKFEFVGSSGISVERQNQVHLPNVKAGTYIVVPVSTGCKIEQQKSDLLASGQSLTQNEFARSTVLSIHSSKAFTLTPHPFDAHTLEQAMELPVVVDGFHMDIVGDGAQQVVLSSRKSGYAGMSYVCSNISGKQAIAVKMDFEGPPRESKNIMSHRGDMTAEIAVPLGESRVMHHIFPQDDRQPWSCGWTVTAKWINTKTMLELQAIENAPKPRREPTPAPPPQSPAPKKDDDVAPQKDDVASPKKEDAATVSPPPPSTSPVTTSPPSPPHPEGKMSSSPAPSQGAAAGTTPPSGGDGSPADKRKSEESKPQRVVSVDDPSPSYWNMFCFIGNP